MDAGGLDTDLEVIDDLAQAVGSSPPVGSGRMGAMSFYPTKVLSAAGDAGMVVCDEPGLAARVRALGSHGASEGQYKRVEGAVGRNSRLDSLHAAVLLAQLAGLEARLMRRRQILGLYREALGESVLAHPAGSPVSIVCMRHPQRDRLLAHLREQGIAAGCYYPRPLSEEPALAEARVAGPLPNSEAFCAEALALPCHGGMLDQDVSKVVDAVRSLP
jgi:dTDP-4-amino-4,6-dideoxygalactose transaminase